MILLFRCFLSERIRSSKGLEVWEKEKSMSSYGLSYH